MRARTEDAEVETTAGGSLATRQDDPRHVPRLSSSAAGGFTLIELLVVVIIIGILAGIAIPSFLSQRERGYEAQLTSDVRNAILDVETGAVGNQGIYPRDQAEFDALGARRSSDTITLTYVTNDARTEFCVEGRDTRLPPEAQTAHYRNGQGVHIFEDCPAL